MRCSTRLSFSLTLLSCAVLVRSQNCQLQVPANPLTAKGLATPYILTGCNQIDFANEGNFVEAAILDPATGNIQIYSPLVINAGMTPAGNGTSAPTTSAGAATGSFASAGSTVTGAATTPTTGASSAAISTKASVTATSTRTPRQATSAGFYIPPIVPTLPDNAVVGIWFGSNAVTLTLTGDTNGCVNGLGNSVFSQFAYCNGPTWFEAAKAAVGKGLVKLPPPGDGSSDQLCPTTHDFRIVDQDQSDNVVTTYLLIGNDTLAQNTPDNNKANPDAEVLSNASDNALVTQFIDPSLGCQPFQNPCPTCPTGQGPALSTDELLAFFFPPPGGPALVPLNDPMVLVNGQQSLDKVNLYRAGTGQPQANSQNASGLAYCQQVTQGGIFINQNEQLFSNGPSPATDQATNLFTFLAMRFSASFGPAPGLGCTGLFNITNPVTLSMNGAGIVTAATINTQVLEQIHAELTGGASSSATAPTGKTTALSTTATGSATATQTGIGVLLHPTSLADVTGSVTPMGITASAGSTNIGAVTVTVTATFCPTQTPASSAGFMPPTSHGGWNGRWNGGWNHTRNHRKRSVPFSSADRMHRKNRIESFE